MIPITDIYLQCHTTLYRLQAIRETDGIKLMKNEINHTQVAMSHWEFISV